MNYVDAGYIVALATIFVYAVTLVLRRRRWARASTTARASEFLDAPAADGITAPVVPGGRP